MICFPFQLVVHNICINIFIKPMKCVTTVKKNWVADNQLFKFPNVTETGCCKILLMRNNL